MANRESTLELYCTLLIFNSERNFKGNIFQRHFSLPLSLSLSLSLSEVWFQSVLAQGAISFLARVAREKVK